MQPFTPTSACAGTPRATAAPRHPAPRPRPLRHAPARTALLALGIGLLASPLAVAAPATIYLHDVLAGDNQVIVSGINRHGHVVGVSGELTPDAFTGVQATFWASGTSTAQALPGFPGVAGRSRAAGINDHNVVVGAAAGRAVQWNANASLAYGDPSNVGSLNDAGHAATHVNNSGSMIGVYGPGIGRTWRWDAATGMQPIGLSTGAYTVPHALNSHGDALVMNTTSDNGRITQIIGADGTVTDVPLPGLLANQTGRFGMNDGRQIAGSRLITTGSGPAFWESFIWSQGVEYALQPLPPVGGTSLPSAQAQAINNPGWVVGQSRLSGLDYAATFWAGGLVWNLNDLLSANDAALWDLTEAVAITDNGWIAGNGRYLVDATAGTWEQRGFSMRLGDDFMVGLPPLFDGGGEPPGGSNPVPLPGTLALSGLAGLALVATRQRQSRRQRQG
jgi:hypothetical protein